MFYCRYIDDGCILWNNQDGPLAWYRFCKDVNDFGILRWTIEERSREVNFLDLTIKINDSNRIETRTYQKPMNLYLYLHHASAHPPGIIKGMIFGEVRRYKLQNTRRTDYLDMLRLLFVRLRARGHSSLLLKKLILEVTNKVEDNVLQ